jgi:hypothetical protein
MNKLILLDKSPIAGSKAIAAAIIALLIIAFLSFASLAKAQNPVTQADARTWMIEHFQIPAKAEITYFFASGNPVTSACISWKIGSGPSVEMHTRTYDFRTQSITFQIDL